MNFRMNYVYFSVYIFLFLDHLFKKGYQTTCWLFQNKRRLTKVYFQMQHLLSAIVVSCRFNTEINAKKIVCFFKFRNGERNISLQIWVPFGIGQYSNLPAIQEIRFFINVKDKSEKVQKLNQFNRFHCNKNTSIK